MADLSLDHLVSLEHQGWMSLCESRGGSFYADTMAEDGLMVLVNGMVLDRDTIAASLDDSPAWDSYELSDTRFIPLGRKAAVLVYWARAHRGDDPPFSAWMSSTYRLADGEPRLALHQQTAPQP